MKPSLKTHGRPTAYQASIATCLIMAASVQFSAAQTNTATGIGAGKKTTSGKHNTSDGFRALISNKTGSFNTAIGSNALASSNGSNNVALGFKALFKNKVGGFNVALGDGALLNNRVGSANIALGEDAGFNIIGSNNICIANKGFAADSGVIRIGSGGVHTNTFIAGVINGNGSGLTGVTVPAANVTGAIPGGQISNNSITSTKLAPAAVTTSELATGAVTSSRLANNLALPGTTTGTFSGAFSGTFSGDINASVLTSSNATISNANGSAIFNPFPADVGANLVGALTGATAGAQLRFQKSGSTDFIDIGQNASEDFVVEGTDVARLTVEKSGNVGVGTSPNSRFHVSGDGVSPPLRVQSGGNSKLTVGINGGTSIGEFQDTPPANGLFVSGNVGIGTSLPDSKLEVRGDIALGSSGQFQAVAGAEKLRVLRGSITADAISGGSGFTLTKVVTGVYRINFSTAFASIPSVTVTVEDTGAPQIATVSGQSSTQVTVRIWNVGSAAIDSDFEFVVIGPR